MSEDIEAVFDNGCPTLPNNWLDEINRHTRALLVDLPPVPSAPMFGGLYAASKAHEEYAEQKFRFDWFHGAPYRLPPLLVKFPDDIDRPRRYSGNSHQRRKQRRARRRTK